MYSHVKKWNARRELFRTMPLRSFLTFCLAVAFTFAAIGVVNDLFDLERSDARHLILKVLTTSGFAVLCVLFIHRRMPKLLLALAVAQVFWLIASARLLPSTPRVLTPQEWQMHVDLHGLLIMVFILFSYGWFGTFFQMEGKRYFAAHTEIELASRIQQKLVPPVELTTQNLEIYGVSIPSGTVGGDLIDAVEANGVVSACVADVAGHGVAAGVLMSMVKTAVRMHLGTHSPAGKGLLEAVNDTLIPLTDPSAYATFAYLVVQPDMRLTYSLAAHPPVFHLQRKTGKLQRHSVENLPLAMFPKTSYETATIDFQQGDILAIVTDGLTEIFDSDDHELGDGYIESTLIRLAALPLSKVADSIFRSARAFGKATDDQTLLLVRRRDS
jgi:sigma-B regulation protein RsbU (phosphoserine phosphatase)